LQYSWQNIVRATFWAILAQTHLVTLWQTDEPVMATADMFLCARIEQVGENAQSMRLLKKRTKSSRCIFPPKGLKFFLILENTGRLKLCLHNRSLFLTFSLKYPHT
jgi:hypothetical protein